MRSTVENPYYKKGFYTVNNQIYFNKFTAIVASQTTGHFPHWNFNNEVFSKANWTHDPQESLWDIYRQRAQQLRDCYDYLVLLYSGGSDSTNILQSFLFNNIKIDEVICWAPWNSKQVNEPLSSSATSTWREVDTVALPYLNLMSKTCDFKVTQVDWTDLMLQGFKDADWIWTDAGQRFVPQIAGRNAVCESSPTANRLLEQGKKVCFISGIDKPKIILKDNIYYCAFLDHITTLGIGHKEAMDGKNWIVNEYFYWTPDLPTLVVKQCHILVKYFENNPDQKHLVRDADQGSWAYFDQYNALIKTLLYPFWQSTTFQTRKPIYTTFLDHDSWFIDSPDLPAKKNWLAGVEEVRRLIDQRWLHQGRERVIDGKPYKDIRLVGTWSPWYEIAREK